MILMNIAFQSSQSVWNLTCMELETSGKMEKTYETYFSDIEKHADHDSDNWEKENKGGETYGHPVFLPRETFCTTVQEWGTNT